MMRGAVGAFIFGDMDPAARENHERGWYEDAAAEP